MKNCSSLTWEEILCIFVDAKKYFVNFFSLAGHRFQRVDLLVLLIQRINAFIQTRDKDYANLLELSEKDAKKEIKEDFNESIQKQFDDSDNITDKEIADYTEKLVAFFYLQDEKSSGDSNV